MSSDKIQCAGCLKLIENKRYLYCGGCNQHFDLDCANISEQRFYNTLTKEHRDAWRCVMCKSRQPKFDNTNTPVRAAVDGVTVQRGGAVPGSPLHMDISLAEQSILNDTTLNTTSEITDIQALTMEIRLFRDEMKSTRAQLKTLNETLTAISSRVSACESRMDKIDECINSLENRMGNMSGVQQCDTSLLASINELKMDINDRDQDLLLNDIEISCISEQKEESLSHVVTTLAVKLGVNLSDQDIVSARRVGRMAESLEVSSERPRPIVVRLARRAIRDQLLQAARVRRGATTEGTGLPGVPRRFYLNERLTKVNRQLFRRARTFCNQYKWRYVWTKEGRIYVRQYHDRDSPRLRLRTDDDFVRVFGPEAVRSIF
ncbi:uncharacterized protein LOC128202525 [Galleria mellonella]|uniref:Uncharacterized protein LOC116412748 n=1 Tax=Galleria mellonella TaxID=7137 RepID=A0A6J3BT44_GALME|nr:uncharacterized protein LOC116412748 [Galleria mellonella]XP_052759182.1 uncharacterized protein LOC128202525 [Galleria mellonella]